ncbi:MAG: glycerol-3-phosphate cytidylyltransferase [Eubacteriales bacterium]
MRKVITYGTFDLLHRGHINILKRAKACGDYLVVAVSSDSFNKIKGKKSYYSEEDRVQILKAIKYVDEVILEYSWEQKAEDVQKHKIDTFVMGDDWKGKFDYLEEYCKVVYLPRTEGVSTTRIKKDLSKDSKKEFDKQIKKDLGKDDKKQNKEGKKKNKEHR